LAAWQANWSTHWWIIRWRLLAKGCWNETRPRRLGLGRGPVSVTT